jgi:putative ABC transport system substrate-binding protein
MSRKNHCCWLSLLLFVSVLAAAGSGMAAESVSGSAPMRKVGIIVYGDPFLKSADGFRAGLAAAGYREGVEVQYSVHNINKNPANVPVLVDEFIRHHYDLILAVTTPVVREVKKATLGKKIPVLFTVVADPVGAKVVDSLKEPGGNISGVSHISLPLTARRLQLFKEAFPGMRRVADVHNPEAEYAAAIHSLLQEEAAAGGLKTVFVHARDAAQMKAACARLSKNEVDGIFMVPDTLAMATFGELLAASRREKLPLMVIDNMLLAEGGALGYGPDIHDAGFQAAAMAVRVFRGAEAGRLPVQNPDKIKLVVSLKEARALGLSPSRDILRQANEVIR